MGLIRGALHIATYGAVSPKSKKQRMAAMQLSALQGKSEAEIKIAGSRNFDFVNQANLRAMQTREERDRRRVAERADSQRGQLQPDWQTGTAQGDAVSELERLAVLRQSGALDDDEFRTAKARILGTSPQKRPNITSATTDFGTRIAALREVVEAEIGKALERKARIQAGEEPELAAVESINKLLIEYAGQLAELDQLEQQLK